MIKRIPFNQLTPEMQSLLLTLSLLTTIDSKAFSKWHLTHCKDLAYRFHRSGEPQDEYYTWLRLEYLAERDLHRVSRPFPLPLSERPPDAIPLRRGAAESFPNRRQS